MADQSMPAPAVDRRWVALAAVTAAGVIVALDTTILNVAVPTVRRDLHTEVSSLQWVLAGYSLTLGSLLIVGGRLGDLFGIRRAFVAGAMVFAVGSLLASAATSVWMLVLGDAVIEGIGASLLLPASLATVSTTFAGPDRAKAFGVTGAAAGAAAALGPVIGGWLTTDFSWRWGFRLNVVVAPLAALVALTVLPRAARRKARPRLDVTGAATIAAGLFLLVFGITEGATYGWLAPIRALRVGSVTVWPASAPLSPAAVAFGLAAATVVGFVAIETRKARSAGVEPLVELGDFRIPGFRFGLTTAAAVVMAQSGAMFVLAVFLQTTHHLTAAATGAWLLPVGALVVVGANVGGAAAGRVGPTMVVRSGVALELLGLAAAAATIATDVRVAVLAPSLALFGFGAGLANSKLWSVILIDVPRDRAGSASGVTMTNNAVAAALGVAVIGTVLRATALTGAGPVRWALLTAVAVVALGTATALAIPRAPGPNPSPPADEHGDPAPFADGADRAQKAPTELVPTRR